MTFLHRHFQGSCVFHTYGTEICQKRRATQHETAGVDPSQSLSFFSRADLAHFDPTAETPCQVSDQFSKINPLLGRVDTRHQPSLKGAIDLNKFEWNPQDTTPLTAIPSTFLREFRQTLDLLFIFVRRLP
jgi:hypothetical protein